MPAALLFGDDEGASCLVHEHELDNDQDKLVSKANQDTDPQLHPYMSTHHLPNHRLLPIDYSIDSAPGCWIDLHPQEVQEKDLLLSATNTHNGTILILSVLTRLC